jgi:hypothetical protein
LLQPHAPPQKICLRENFSSTSCHVRGGRKCNFGLIEARLLHEFSAELQKMLLLVLLCRTSCERKGFQSLPIGTSHVLRRCPTERTRGARVKLIADTTVPTAAIASNVSGPACHKAVMTP